MSRFINALLIFLMVLSAAAVYDMKYEAELAAADVARLEREIEQQRATISMFKAEWSMLSQPKRLQTLVDRHNDVLGLEALTASHFGSLADIPPKPVVIEPAGDDRAPTGAPVQRAASVALPDAASDPSDDSAEDGAVMVR